VIRECRTLTVVPMNGSSPWDRVSRVAPLLLPVGLFLLFLYLAVRNRFTEPRDPNPPKARPPR
jgi:hypothetical protein